MSILARNAQVHNAVGGLISPLSPGSKLDGWETPLSSAGTSPVPTKCHELPDYVPPRNHQRSKDSQWGTQAQAQAPAPPPVAVAAKPQRPRPTRLATPNSGYPFPWVLSRSNTAEDNVPTTSAPPAASTSHSSDSISTASSSSSPPSDAGSCESSTSSASSSSSCPTPKDATPLPSPKKAPSSTADAPTTPFDETHARTKNACYTPGAPPPMGFVGDGKGRSFRDFRDVKNEQSGDGRGDIQRTNSDMRRTTSNPLASGLAVLNLCDNPEHIGA